jgi:hypothetical protein
MVLERGEPGDCLPPDLEGRDAVGDPLLGSASGRISRITWRSWASTERFGSSRASRYWSIC